MFALAIIAVTAAVAGYLLGSLPFGYLVARAHGVNIFAVGSRSPGATNVRRVLGKGPGNLVFALDAVKGAVATGWPLLYFWSRHEHHMSDTTTNGHVVFAIDLNTTVAVLGLAGALLGHSFSCFTRFRGGKGVATGAGGLVVLMPLIAAISGAVWVVMFYTTRYVSLASIIAALAMPIAAFFLHQPPLLVGLAIALCSFVIVRHLPNIGRLLAGTEHRFGRKPDEKKAAGS
jgi:acyl phosphate:glycerol-3-phosphate acyltransferase